MSDLHEGYVRLYSRIEAGWCKWRLEDAQGNVCLLGGIFEIEPFDCEARFALKQGLRAHPRVQAVGWPKLNHSIPRFNNHPQTTKADVLAVIADLIAETAPPPAIPAMSENEEFSALETEKELELA